MRTHTQTGATLLVFLTVLIMGAGALLLSKLERTTFVVERQLHTSEVLERAKEALLGYAVSYFERQGGPLPDRLDTFLLPCPDSDAAGTQADEGQADDCSISGAGVSTLGRLPWRTLGLPPLIDGSGECLWYAVSGYHKEINDNQHNDQAPGLFSIYTQLSNLNERLVTDDVVAVIIAPDRPFDQQDRSLAATHLSACGGNYMHTHYLEGENQNFLTTKDIENKFIQALDAGTISINDRIVYITREELVGAVRLRRDYQEKIQDFTRLAAMCIAKFSYDAAFNAGFTIPAEELKLPWPSAMTVDDDGRYHDYHFLDGGKPASFNMFGPALPYLKPKPYLSGRIPEKGIVSSAQVEEFILYKQYGIPLVDPEDDKVYIPSDDGDVIPSACFTNDAQLEHLTEGDTTPQQLFQAWDETRFMSMWNEWKESLFYVVSEAHQPDGPFEYTPSCDSGDICIYVKSQTPPHYRKMAAIIIFAGEPLEGQSRDTPAKKGDMSNYLEGVNLISFMQNEGRGEFHQWDMSQGINDILYCIQRAPSGYGLEIDLCPGLR